MNRVRSAYQLVRSGPHPEHRARPPRRRPASGLPVACCRPWVRGAAGLPRLITRGGGLALTPVSFSDPDTSEDWLQRQIDEHPELLPIDEIAPRGDRSFRWDARYRSLSVTSTPCSCRLPARSPSMRRSCGEIPRPAAR